MEPHPAPYLSSLSRWSTKSERNPIGSLLENEAQSWCTLKMHIDQYVEVEEHDKSKAALAIRRMPFGLLQCPCHFSKVMECVVTDDDSIHLKTYSPNKIWN